MGLPAFRLDVLFAINLVFDLFLFWFAGNISWARPRWWRILLAAVVGAALTLLPVSTTWGYQLLTGPAVLVISGLLVLLVVWPCSPRQYVAAFGGLWVVSGAAGGVTMLLAERYTTGPLTVALVGGGMAGTLVGLQAVWQTYRERRVVCDALCPFQLQLGDQTVVLTGLVDSGNSVATPLTRRPVAIVEVDRLRPYLPPGVVEALSMGWDALAVIPPEWRNRCQLIPYSAVGNHSSALLALAPDRMSLWEKGGRRWVEVSGVIGLTLQQLESQGQYQVLLSPRMLQEAEGK